MRLITTLLLIAFSFTASAQEVLTSSSLAEKMLQDSIVLRSMNDFAEWQRLQKEGAKTAQYPLSQKQRTQLREDPSLALELYTSAGYKDAETIAVTYISLQKTSDEFMAKYTDELMALPINERLRVLQLLEEFKAKQ